MKNKKFHKQIRIHHPLYKEPNNVCSLTICASYHKEIFKNNDFAKSCVNLLKGYCQTYNIPLYAFCFMPDHLHLLIGPSERKGIIEFVREFKGKTTRLSWVYGLKGTFWQKSFYDHFLRKEEVVKTAVKYILNNPVRQGLVEFWDNYPFSGSLVFSLEDIEDLERIEVASDVMSDQSGR